MGKSKSKSSTSSSQPENPSSYTLKVSNSLISLNPDDYESHIRVIIEFLSKHPLSVPLTKSPSNFPNRLLELAHDHLKYIKETDAIKVAVTHRRYAPITKSIFLRAIAVPQNPESFTLIKPSDDDLLSFIQDVRYTGTLDNGLPDFKKSFIFPHRQVSMHLLMKSLSGKTGGTDQIGRDWICLAYSFYTGNAFVIDIPSLLWNDFVQYAKRKKDKQINSAPFLALALEELYRHHNYEKLQQPDEVCVSFKPLNPYNGSDSSRAEHVVRLPQCMFDLLDQDSPYLAQHLADTTVLNPS